MLYESAPAVSVIVSVYNSEKYITECIESILSQTLENTEIICVDDASTDGTAEILKQYQDRLSILINMENCGAGESRNKGLQVAKGEYIIFLDADDLFEPCMLERAYHKAKLCNADICVFKEDLFSENTQGNSNYSYAEVQMKKLGEMDFFAPEELRDVLFLLWNGWAWDKLFRREFIVNAGLRFQNIRTSNDGFFVHAALATASKISMLNEILIHHRIGNTSSLSNTRDYAWESCLIYLKELKQYLDQRKLFSVYERNYVNWAAEFLYWNYRTLGDTSRGQLAEAAAQFFMQELNLGQYRKEYFYDAFLWWFAKRLIKRETEQIPLTEQGHFEKLYQLNTNKLDELYAFIMKRRWGVALWGAGIRGNAFAKMQGNNWHALRIVYDMNAKKHGQKLCGDMNISRYDRERDDGINCIIVLNSAHLLSVKETVGGAGIVLFDMNTYLAMPVGIDHCIMECQSGGL